MLNDWRFWVVFVVASATGLLAIINFRLQNENVDLSEQIGERQTVISLSTRLGRINQGLIEGLANVAAQTNDEQIKAMLARNGITYSLRVTSSEGADDAGQ
jgi:hypothetical protein